MAYTPTQWGTGDTITASALNKIEQGVADAGGALIVDWSGDSAQPLSKTVQEIYDAFSSGIPVYLRYMYGDPGIPYSQGGYYNSFKYLAPITTVSRYGDQYYTVGVSYCNGDYSRVSACTMRFTASTFNGYPTLGGSHNYTW